MQKKINFGHFSEHPLFEISEYDFNYFYRINFMAVAWDKYFFFSILPVVSKIEKRVGLFLSFPFSVYFGIGHKSKSAPSMGKWSWGVTQDWFW